MSVCTGSDRGSVTLRLQLQWNVNNRRYNVYSNWKLIQKYLSDFSFLPQHLLASQRKKKWSQYSNIILFYFLKYYIALRWYLIRKKNNNNNTYQNCCWYPAVVVSRKLFCIFVLLILHYLHWWSKQFVMYDFHQNVKVKKLTHIDDAWLKYYSRVL